MGNLKMDIPEKLATLGIQDTGQTQTKTAHHYTHTNTNNIRLYQFFKISVLKIVIYRKINIVVLFLRIPYIEPHATQVAKFNK
jgi:hypothetical protein